MTTQFIMMVIKIHYVNIKINRQTVISLAVRGRCDVMGCMVSFGTELEEKLDDRLSANQVRMAAGEVTHPLYSIE